MKKRLLLCVLLTLACEAWLEGNGYAPPMLIGLLEEGSGLGSISKLDCVGAGVTCTASGGTGTITVPLGAGAGPAGNTNELQYNAGSGVFGGVANLETDGTDAVLVPATTPAAGPSAGVKLSSHAPTSWTFPFANLRTPNERTLPILPIWAVGGSTCVLPGTSSTWAGYGWAPVVQGGATTPAIGTSSILDAMRRTHLASAAGAGSAGGIRPNFDTIWRGTSAGLGGFLVWARWATTTALAQQRAFIGVVDGTGVLANANPSTALDTAYIGYDSAATVLSACSNDNSGSATCTSLGANFPVNATAVYDVWLYAPPNGTEIDYYVERLDSAQTASGAFTSDLPRNSVMYSPQIWVNNGTTAVIAAIDIAAFCTFSQF